MVQSSNDAAMKDATTKFREEEYVLGMVQKSKEASCAPKDAQTMPRKVECVSDMEQQQSKTLVPTTEEVRYGVSREGGGGC